jgi:2-polyprenyl-3-methyl-5-hydroxy-6-metoxy-1,4-benzoquinol methylase
MATKRSQEKELIDLGPNFYTEAEYHDCLKKLFRVNRLFGIFFSTRKKIMQFPHATSLLDVGCGGGLFLLNLSKYFKKLNMLGLDINPAAIGEAQKTLSQWQQRSLAEHVTFECHPNPDLSLKKQFDVILATLVCHHLTDEELIQFLKDAYANSRQGVVINDLHRHGLAQVLFFLFSPLLFNNRLISHDGLISIKRSFTYAEWKYLLARANIKNYQIKWCFPFRWQIVIWKSCRST